jgi:O-succinylbenzoate synthase
MKKRLLKKKVKYIIDNIQTVKLQEGEFLAFRFDTNKWSPAQMEQFAKYIKENVSTKVFFVPKDIDMRKVIEV